MENERRYRRRNSDVKEENMESSEQEPRTVRHEYGSSSAGDSIGQARRVIDELEARINDARRVPMSKTLSIIDTGELIDLIGRTRSCRHRPFWTRERKFSARRKRKRKHRWAKRTPITPKRWKTPNALSRT